MALDPYTPCPCGSGKKLKFCECAAESAELEKVLTAIDGDQRVAALDLIDRTLATKPNQKAMLALKGIVQAQLGDVAGAKKTVTTFLGVAPNNPVALTLSALIDSGEGKTGEGVIALQKALAASTEEIHYLIPDALLTIAQSLLMEGNVLAARAHLLLRIAMMGQDDRTGVQQLIRINSSQELPLVVKQDLSIQDLKRPTAWEKEFHTAIEAAGNGNWLSAANQLEALDKKFPNEPEILFNLAIFKTFLAQDSAYQVWRRYANLSEISTDQAVEAEILAQELDPEPESESIDQMRIVYSVKDAGRLSEVLVSDRRVVRMPVDLSQLVPEGSPPPRAAYWLLDRETPETGKDLTYDKIPRVVGEVLLFGRETDREARLEFLVTKSPELVNKVRRLQEVGADQLGRIEREERVGVTSALDEAMVARWRLPEDTPAEIRKALVDEHQQRNVFEVLPKQPMKLFGGKSAREVASDPVQRVRLLAFLRNYELSFEQRRQTIDFNELRRQLGLPLSAPLDPNGIDMAEVPLLRLGRFDLKPMNAEQLTSLLRRCGSVDYVSPLRRAAQEVLDRGGLPGQIEKADAYGVLAMSAGDLDQALEYVQLAQKSALEQGTSPARFLLEEFDIRLARREPNEVSRIMNILQTKYMREPGIAEALYMKMMQLGLINQDGTPRMGGPSRAAAPVEQAPAAGGLWTPDGPSAAAPAAQGQSKLWLPGMD